MASPRRRSVRVKFNIIPASSSSLATKSQQPSGTEHCVSLKLDHTAGIERQHPEEAQGVAASDLERESFKCTTAIVEIGYRLKMAHGAVHTAVSLYHRYTSSQAYEKDAISSKVMGMVCIFIAVKIEEIDGVRLRDVILCAYRVYRPDIPVLVDEVTYNEIKLSVLAGETSVLRALGFQVKVDTPQKFLLHQALLYANWLGDEVCRSRPLTSLALALLRDAAHCRQLCSHTPPERLSAACLYLAVKCLKLDVADGPLAGFEWWKPLSFDGAETELRCLSRSVMRVYRLEERRA